MSLAGFYINLDRSADRDASMRAQLEALSLAGRYSRFPAVDGALLSGLASMLLPGGVGCFMSYFRVLEKNLGSEQHLHVMEDDTIMSRYAAKIIQSIVNSRTIENYEIIMTETLVDVNIGLIDHQGNRVKEYVTNGESAESMPIL